MGRKSRSFRGTPCLLRDHTLATGAEVCARAMEWRKIKKCKRIWLNLVSAEFCSTSVPLAATASTAGIGAESGASSSNASGSTNVAHGTADYKTAPFCVSPRPSALKNQPSCLRLASICIPAFSPIPNSQSSILHSAPQVISIYPRGVLAGCYCTGCPFQPQFTSARPGSPILVPFG